MSSYKIVGDYTIRDSITEKSGELITIRIPLTAENGSLLYGIDRIRNDLKQKGIYPTEDGFDILALAALVYLADTRISRSKHAEDSWTREISLEVPVFNFERWLSQGDLLAQMLNFLTGDRWIINFAKRENAFSDESKRRVKYDAVTLFSGGMDSLIGTINHLERNRNVAMFSHAGDGYTKDVQKSLLAEFKERYPDNIPSYFSLWMSFKKDILFEGGQEDSTRSRSFLFISLGLFALSGMDGVTVLQVPENGLIALNVPLDTLRVGSHSTRTTHPFYMKLWNNLLANLGLPYSIDNPYWNKTKGEMANDCLNRDFLLKVINKSTSCSAPTKLRWEKLPSQHCGYCVPCLIRRAAMHNAYGLGVDTTTYARKSINELIQSHAKRKGEQLRSFQIAIKRIKDNPSFKNILIYKGGKLDGDMEYINQLADVYYRGLIEVDNFISAHLVYESDKGEY